MTRPKKTIREQDYEVIRDMAARGCREIDIARAMGVSYNTWMRIKDEDERALNALEAGRGIEHEKLVGALFEAAMKGNVVAGIFLLKARHGYREGFTVEHNSNVKISVELPAALNTDQYEKVIEHERIALPEETNDS